MFEKPCHRVFKFHATDQSLVKDYVLFRHQLHHLESQVELLKVQLFLVLLRKSLLRASEVVLEKTIIAEYVEEQLLFLSFSDCLNFDRGGHFIG